MLSKYPASTIKHSNKSLKQTWNPTTPSSTPLKMSKEEKSSSEILNELFSTFNSSFSADQSKSKKSKKKKKKRDSSTNSSSTGSPVKKSKQSDKKKSKEKVKEKVKKHDVKKIKEKIKVEKKKVKKKPEKKKPQDKIPIGDGFVVFSKSKPPDVEDGEIIDDEVDKKPKRSFQDDKLEFMSKSTSKLSASQAYKLDAEEKLLLGYGIERTSSKPLPSSSTSSYKPHKRSRSGSPSSSRSRKSRRSRSRSPTRPRVAPPRDQYRSSYLKFEKQREDAYERERQSSRNLNYDTDSYCEYHASRSRNTGSSSRSGFGYVGKSYYYDDVDESPPEKRDKPRDYGSSSWRHKHRSRSRSKSPRRSYYHPDDIIDKSELLEIARKNARKLLKSGVIGSDIFSRDQILAIKAGGKNVEDLTNYCRRLAKRDALGDARSSDEEDERFIHHPFHVKDKPLPTITLNIRNAVPLPVRTPQELAIESAKLRTVFPVSSGTQHRFKELEWKPVQDDDKKEQSTELVPLDGEAVASTAKPETASNVATVAPMMREDVQESSTTTTKELLAIEAPPPPPKDDGISLDLPELPNVDISSVIGLRLKAMRMLQENPDSQNAKKQLEDATKLMKNWADAKALEPKFLTPAELSSGPQAWAKRDQLRKTTKLDSGMGMHLLQKMGWRPGEGLGKNKEGQLEPLALDVKTDKKGLTAAVEELMFGGKKNSSNSGPSMPVVYDLSGKHPVSALMELTAKRRWGAPEFQMCFEHGPPHKRQFVYKVIVNGVEYQPCVAVGNKKQAKANAAAFCLQSLGLLPTGSVQANELLQTVTDTPEPVPVVDETPSNPLGRSFTNANNFLQTVKTDDELMPPPKMPT